MKLTAIEFLASASPYHAGDVAGFEPSVAQAYIDAGVARPHAADGKAKKQAKENKPAKSNAEPATPATPADAEQYADQDAGQGAHLGAQELGE